LRAAPFAERDKGLRGERDEWLLLQFAVESLYQTRMQRDAQSEKRIFEKPPRFTQEKNRPLKSKRSCAEN